MSERQRSWWLAGLGVSLAIACTDARGDESVQKAIGASGSVAINELMIDPDAAPDEHGEWLELLNFGRDTIQLRGWRIRSGNDRPWRIAADLALPPGGLVVLGRSADRARNGDVPVALPYGSAFALGNGRDWLAVDDPQGITVDSVAWRRAPRGAALGRRDPSRPAPDAGDDTWREQTTRFRAGDRGTPAAWNDGAVAPELALARGFAPVPVAAYTPPPLPGDSSRRVGVPRLDESVRFGDVARSRELLVHVLDVGQGDAILIRNGGSTVLVDGGPEPARLGSLLDSLQLGRDTIDVVILTHAHYDHYSGLRELFRTRRGLHLSYFFENRDPSPNSALAELRDSVAARAERGALVLRDTDDPCGDGRALCTVTLRGGARLHVMRPMPTSLSDGQNDRSVQLKLVGPDSASFTMWLSGDAEHGALSWIEREYGTNPGLRVDVVKLSHHGSCNGLSARLLRALGPRVAVASLAGVNDYGHVHAQTTALLRQAGVPWYRTDVNGTVTLRSVGTPGSGFVVEASRGVRSPAGVSDRPSRESACRQSRSYTPPRGVTGPRDTRSVTGQARDVEQG